MGVDHLLFGLGGLEVFRTDRLPVTAPAWQAAFHLSAGDVARHPTASRSIENDRAATRRVG
jgi:hypothetical protein